MTKRKLFFWGLVGALFVVLAAAGCFPAQPDGGEQTSPIWPLIVFLIVIFALMYFVMIRPQRNRQKQQVKIIQAIKKGDRIITVGGIFGVIDEVKEDSFVIRVESGALLRVTKGSVTPIPEGS